MPRFSTISNMVDRNFILWSETSLDEVSNVAGLVLVVRFLEFGGIVAYLLVVVTDSFRVCR